VVIAATHEFGAGNIPERSFLRVPLRANQDAYAAIFKRGLPQVISGQLTAGQIMEQVGARAAADSQEAISAGIAPPNAPSTIARKGSSKPLIDTGRLRQSITYEVGE
jgi:phage gpG-like protein